MQLEREGKHQEAAMLFMQAWNEANTYTEKFVAAHYVARQQPNVSAKLEWDTKALNLARKIPGNDLKPVYPSLYLNIAKGYEDLKDFVKANENYQAALGYVIFLPNDGYGDMIRTGIANGIARIKT